MGRVILFELEILGSHGMSAVDYPEMLACVASGKIDPSRLVGRSIALSEAPKVLAEMNNFKSIGMTVIEDFAN
jgi:alcohol dehydrogenase